MINEQLLVAFKPFKYCRGLDDNWVREVNKTQCVFFLVNQIKEGTMARKADDVIGVNALFIDVDGTREWNGVDGSVVCGRDKTHWHAYWPLVEGEDMKKWDMAQDALIKHFGSDPACSDRSRVMRVPNTVNHKDGLGKPIHAVWKNEDKKWTIDEVVGYYGLDLVEVVAHEHLAMSMEGVSCPGYIRDELVQTIEGQEVSEGERYATARNWSAQALGAGMDSAEVHEVVAQSLERWGYSKEKALEQASNAQSGTVEKLKAGKLHVDERYRPDTVFPDADTTDKKLKEDEVEEQAKALGVESLIDSLKSAPDKFTWLSENAKRVMALGAVERGRLRSQWGTGVRVFDQAVVEASGGGDDTDWEVFASEFLSARPAPLIFIDNTWFSWCGTHYQEVEEVWVKKEVSARVDRPSMGRVGNAFQQVSFAALRDMANEPEGVPFLNGRLIDGKLVEHTPENGGRYVLDFEYNPNAKCPTWERCLSEWFPDVEDERILILREWMNYLLLRRDNIQKIMLMMGAQRGGKGTILSVMQDLLGEDNYATPTMSSFASEFGLQSSIGKQALFISDAHLPRRDRSTILDRLKSISGKDRVDVNRKNMPIVKGVRLGQLVVACNEMDDIRDESNALIDRYSVIKFTRSFLGREDNELGAKIKAELPGIFNWAMSCHSFVRFREDRRGKSEKEGMSLSANPIRAWASENLTECRMVEGVDTDDLFAMFQQFCREDEIHSIPHKNTFMKKLRGVFPDSEINEKRVGGKKFKRLMGVGLARDILHENEESTGTEDKFEQFASEV